jgi:hypothetical protein
MRDEDAIFSSPEPGQLIMDLDADKRLLFLSEPRRGSLMIILQRWDPNTSKWVPASKAEEVAIGLLVHKLKWSQQYLRERLKKAEIDYGFKVSGRDWNLQGVGL